METNIQAFTDFRNNINDPIRLANGDELIQAIIQFKFKNRVIEEELEVTLHLTTMEYGIVSLADGDTVNAMIAHMDFYPKYQDYILEENHSLVITGKSDKMGRYEVRITQV